MRPFQDYKKRFKLIFCILVVFLTAPVFFSFAQTAKELQNKIDQRNNDIVKLEIEIRSYQKELDELGQEKNSLSSSIKALDITRKKLNADISITENKIEKTNFKIQGLSEDISTKQNSISNNMQAIAASIKITNEFENSSLVEILLSAEDFTLAWNDIDQRISVREKIIDHIEILRGIKVELEDTRAETIEAKNELLNLKTDLADQRKIVEQNSKEKNKLLAQTKNSEAGFQKIIKERLAQKDALERELRAYESELVYILDPSKLPNAGVLSWPLDFIYITQLFGKTSDSKRLYASGTHSGVDFRATVGTSVKSMASGIVVGVGDTDTQCPGASFGKFILIKYDNGLSSAYGHLSLVKARVGDRVVRGTVVAYSGNTGYSTGPHLHVSLYASDAVGVKSIPSKSCPGRILTQPIAAINAYLDPMYYLPSYSSR